MIQRLWIRCSVKLYHDHRNLWDWSWFFGQNMIFALTKKCVREHLYDKSIIGSPWDSNRGPSESETDLISIGLRFIFWRRSHFCREWTWVLYINYVLSINDSFRYSKLLMSTCSDSICENTFETSHVRFIHENFSVLITTPLDQIQKKCWEKRPAKPRQNLQTSFCRRDLKNTQPHLKVSQFLSRQSYWAR